MTNLTPTTIPAYLEQLRQALRGADPALVQDALYDAEEYLRAELAEHPQTGETEMLAAIAGSYGAPEEVAEIYLVKEDTVIQALRRPPVPPRKSALGRFVGVVADPRAYTALFYMLLSSATGTFYFGWTVTGLSLSAGLAMLIIGVPFVIVFFASVRALSLVEGTLVEAMLGERMPRRPPYTDRDAPMRTRIWRMFTDPRTWSTLLYMLLMLPLGIVYFTVVVTLVTFSLALAALPILQQFSDAGLFVNGLLVNDIHYHVPLWTAPLTLLAGFVLIVLTLHLARGIGHFHGSLAKHLLVKSGRV